MPVEIKELVIRAILTDDTEKDTISRKNDLDSTAIVQECVEQVLKVLKKQNRR